MPVINFSDSVDLFSANEKRWNKLIEVLKKQQEQKQAILRDKEFEKIFTENKALIIRLIPTIIQNLSKDDLQTQKEAAWVVLNLTIGGTKDQVAHLIRQGAIPPLCNLLNCNDLAVVQIVLGGIHNMIKMYDEITVKQLFGLIEECSGLDKIEKLQVYEIHENIEITKLAYDIIEAESLSTFAHR